MGNLNISSLSLWEVFKEDICQDWMVNNFMCALQV